MDLKEYQQRALVHESKIEKLSFNRDYVVNLLKIFVELSEALDGLKKSVFYKKDKKANEVTMPSLRNISDLTRDAVVRFQNKDHHNSDIELDPRVFHGILGIMTEAGELAEILVKNLQDNIPVDPIHVLEESAGDQGWYTAILLDSLNLDWEEGLKRNIAKLDARNPLKNLVASKEEIRDLNNERKILEGK